MKILIIPEKIPIAMWIGTQNMKPMSIAIMGEYNNKPTARLIIKDIPALPRLRNIMNAEYISWKD